MKRFLILAAAASVGLMGGAAQASTTASTPASLGTTVGVGATKGSGATETGGQLGTSGVMTINAPTVQSFAFSNGTQANQMQYSGSAGQSNSFSVGELLKLQHLHMQASGPLLVWVLLKVQAQHHQQENRAHQVS